MTNRNRMMRTWVKATDFAISLASGAVTVVNLFSDYETEQGLQDVRGTVSAFYGEVVIKPQALLATGVMGLNLFPPFTTHFTTPSQPPGGVP